MFLGSVLSLGVLALAAPPAGDGLVGVVCRVKVVSDKVEDVSSMDAWKRSFIKEGMTDRQKALATWETVVKFEHQDHCPPWESLQANTGQVDDPIKMFNVYGYGICGEATSSVVALARHAGLKARGWGINNHSVPEVFWDGEWHMLDAALINDFPKADGKIASVEEIVADVAGWHARHPGYRGDRQKLLAFMEADGGKGWKKGPELLARCPFLDARGWFPSGESGWYATMLEFDGTQGGNGKPYVWEFGYSQGYQVNIQLRPGERLTRNWSNKGLHVNEVGPPDAYNAATGATEFVPWCLDKKVGEGFLKYSPEHGDLAPGRIGNGTLEYDVPLADGAFRRGSLSAENLACRDEDRAGPALHVKDPARPGTLVIRMPTSYVYLGGTLTLKAVVPGGEVAVELSDNNGLDWKPVARLDASGERTLDLKPFVFRRYDDRLKLTLKGRGTGLDALRIVHDIQHSQRPLPALARGPNTIAFTTDPDHEGTITVEGSVDPGVAGKQLTYKDFHPRVNGVADTVLEGWPNFHVVGERGDVTFPIATPGDMTRLRFGCSYRAKDEADGWDLQVSFDDGKSFKTVGRCAGPGSGVMKAGHSRYVTVSDVPPGTRKALVRWSGTRIHPGSDPQDVWNSTTAVYGFRIDADYREPHGGFRPVKVTYTWEEDGRPKTHVYVARKPQETYRIDCAAKPLMKSIALELAK